MLDLEELEHINFLKNKYIILDKIGEGTFSRVYKAQDIRNSKIYALKVITKTSSPNRVVDELNFLVELDGKDNCIPLFGVLRHEDQIVAVFPYYENTEFRSFLSLCTELDAKKYMYNLIVAVNHIHNCNIIHRDIKPGNYLYNKEAQTGVVIDFGLAQYYGRENKKREIKSPVKPVIFFNSVISKSKPPGYYERDTRPQIRAPRAGTRGFRAPEVLFKYQYQTSAIDMWSVGVIMLNVMTSQYPFFYSGDDLDALVELGTIFGQKEMRKIAKFYGRVWKSNIDTIPEERIPFERLVESYQGCNGYGKDAFDLLYKLLDLNCETRITARDALNHNFFDAVREDI